MLHAFWVIYPALELFTHVSTHSSSDRPVTHYIYLVHHVQSPVPSAPPLTPSHCCSNQFTHSDQLHWSAAWQCFASGLQCITSCFLSRGQNPFGTHPCATWKCGSWHLWGCLWRMGNEGQYVNAFPFHHSADGFEIHLIRLLRNPGWMEQCPWCWPSW